MDLMLHEMETYLLGARTDMEMGKLSLADIFSISALLANFIYGSYTVRFVCFCEFNSQCTEFILINVHYGKEEEQIRKRISFLQLPRWQQEIEKAQS